MKAITPTFLVLFSAVATAASLQPPQAVDDEFHFVVLGDAQFDTPANFNRIIDQAKRLGPAFVIQVGDLIDGYNSDLSVVQAEWNRFKNQIAPLAPIPFYAVPGNHDVYGSGKAPDKKLEDLFEQEWGPLNYSFEYKNSLFVVLNSDAREKPEGIGPKQLRWLAETLAASDAQHRFVFLHRPPMLMDNDRELHEVFKNGGVNQVFYGHHHHYHHYTLDGVGYTMTNAGGRMGHDDPRAGSFFHLLQVSVRGEDVRVAVVKADAVQAQNSVHPADNYDIFNLTRRLAPKSVRLVGKDGSYQLKIPLANRTRRDVQVFTSCTSADNRWEIEPTRINVVELEEDTTSLITLEVSHQADRVPESMPICTLTVPLQTQFGEWLDFTHEVSSRYPK